MWVRCLPEGGDAVWLRLHPDTGAVVPAPGGCAAGPGSLEALEGLASLEFPRHVAVLPAWVSRLTSMALVNLVRLDAADNARALEARLAGDAEPAEEEPAGAAARRTEGVRIRVSVGWDGEGLRADFVTMADAKENAAGLEERLSAVVARAGLPLVGWPPEVVSAELVALADARWNAASLEDRFAQDGGPGDGGALRADLVPLPGKHRDAATLEDRLSAERPSVGPEPVPLPSPPRAAPARAAPDGWSGLADGREAIAV
jgi:hypothetical protein